MSETDMTTARIMMLANDDRYNDFYVSDITIEHGYDGARRHDTNTSKT